MESQTYIMTILLTKVFNVFMFWNPWQQMHLISDNNIIANTKQLLKVTITIVIRI